MSVLPSEGTHVILYGGINIPAGTQVHSGYLARPDVGGSFPTVVVVHDRDGVDSSTKDLCRRLARHGFTAVSIDLYRGQGPGRKATEDEVAAAAASLPERRALADLEDLYGFIASPGTPWSDERRVGLLGLGWGGRLGMLSAAAARDLVRAVVVAYAPLDGESPLATAVTSARLPLLCLYGRDGAADLEAVKALREVNSRTEIVVYNDVGDGFLDDGSDRFDAAAREDAIERFIGFFSKRLAPRTSEPAA